MSDLSPSRTIRTIVYATDFSAASDEAFRAACALAAAHSAKLIVVHVAAPSVTGLGITDSFVLRDDYLGAIEARLRSLQGRAPHVPMQFRIEEGHPSIEIVKLARATGAGLIVIGSRGSHAPHLPPSTTHEVFLLAPCAVSIVEPKQIQQASQSLSKEPSHERATYGRERAEIL